MTDLTQLSDKELSEAINFHRRQRNLSRGVNEAHHMRQTQMVRLLEAEEVRRLEEAVQVDKKNYSWGKMITVRHGSSHSFPLHPEHQEKIKNLKDGESTAFRDETGSHVTAHREGDKVHLKLRGANQKTTVAHSHFTEEVKLGEDNGPCWDGYRKDGMKIKNGKLVNNCVKEEVEQIDEVSASTLRSYIDKSRADKKAAMKDRTAAEKNVKKYGMASDKKERDDAARRVGNRNQGISVANKKLGTYPADKAKAKVMAREEVEQIDEISTELKKRYVEKGADDVVDRFTGRGKYERPRNPAHFTKTGRVKKSALNRPEAIKYREKLDNRRDIVNKVSQEVHGKKRFGEEVEINEAAMDKNHPIVKEYQAMKKHDIKTLRGMIAGQRRISDTSEFKTKDHAISSYLRAKHGNKAVDKAFGFNEEIELDEAESWEAGYKRRVVKTTSAEHKEKGYSWRIKGKERPEISIKLYKEKPSQEEFNKQMKRVAGHEFGG